jgi:hypothetical protein
MFLINNNNNKKKYYKTREKSNKKKQHLKHLFTRFFLYKIVEIMIVTSCKRIRYKRKKERELNMI